MYTRTRLHQLYVNLFTCTREAKKTAKDENLHEEANACLLCHVQSRLEKTFKEGKPSRERENDKERDKDRRVSDSERQTTEDEEKGDDEEGWEKQKVFPFLHMIDHSHLEETRGTVVKKMLEKLRVIRDTGLCSMRLKCMYTASLRGKEKHRRMKRS